MPIEAKHIALLRGFLRPGMGKGSHNYPLKVANYGILSGDSQETVYNDILAAIPLGGKCIPNRQSWDAELKKRRPHHNAKK